MNDQPQSALKLYWAFSLSCFFAFTLMLVRVPDWLSAYWPDWIALVIVYWALVAPDRIGPVAGFIIGTMLEVLFARTFGVLSTGLAVLAFLVNIAHMQLRITSRWQQVFLLVLLVGVFKLTNLWFESLVENATLTGADWLSLIGNLVVWPFLNIVLDEFRRMMRIR